MHNLAGLKFHFEITAQPRTNHILRNAVLRVLDWHEEDV
jgi:hypothetical protein